MNKGFFMSESCEFGVKLAFILKFINKNFKSLKNNKLIFSNIFS